MARVDFDSVGIAAAAAALSRQQQQQEQVAKQRRQGHSSREIAVAAEARNEVDATSASVTNSLFFCAAIP